MHRSDTNPYLSYLYNHPSVGRWSRIGHFFSAMLGEGIEVERIRAYQPWDTTNHIHRKATAKTWMVHVNQYTTERTPHLEIFCDINPNWHAGIEQVNRKFVVHELSMLLDFLQRGGITWTCWWYTDGWQSLSSHQSYAGDVWQVSHVKGGEAMDLLLAAWQPLLDSMVHCTEWFSYCTPRLSMIDDGAHTWVVHHGPVHRVVFSDFLEKDPQIPWWVSYVVTQDSYGHRLDVVLHVDSRAGKNFSAYDIRDW
jgi:hypothetical protein